MTLRSRLIHLAHEKPEVRKAILPLLKTAKEGLPINWANQLNGLEDALKKFQDFVKKSKLTDELSEEQADTVKGLLYPLGEARKLVTKLGDL